MKSSEVVPRWQKVIVLVRTRIEVYGRCLGDIEEYR